MEYIEVAKDLEFFSYPTFPLARDQEWYVFTSKFSDREKTFFRFIDKDNIEFRNTGIVKPYLSFLRDDLAQLPRLADVVVRTSEIYRSGVNNFNNIPFIRSFATLVMPADGEEVEDHAIELIRKIEAREREFDSDMHESVQVVYVAAPAGHGKTHLLREVAYRSAKDFLSGSQQSLFLYIDAQASKVTTIQEAIAVTLDILGSHIDFRSIPRLVHHRLLSIIIDGFDELYALPEEDTGSFSSLRRFIELADGGGTIITSARNAYYDIKTFESRSGVNFNIYRLTLKGWTNFQIEEYIKNYSICCLKDTSRADDHVRSFHSIYQSLSTDDNSFLRVPFFVATITEMLGDDNKAHIFAGVGDGHTKSQLLATLVTAMLERESEKKWSYKEADGKPIPFTSVEFHNNFLSNLAEDMWLLSSPYFDETTLVTAVEIASGDLELSVDVQQQVVDRAKTHAFLLHEGKSRSIKFKFAHPIYFSYFLSLAHWAKWTNVQQGSYYDYLRFVGKDYFSVETGHFIATMCQDRDLQDVANEITSLLIGRNNFILKANFGRIVAGFVKLNVGRIGAIKGLVFREDDISDAIIKDIDFEECEFSDVDLTNTEFEAVTFSHCTLGPLEFRAQSQPRFCSAKVTNRVTIVPPMQIDDIASTFIERVPPRIMHTLISLGLEVPRIGIYPVSAASEYSEQMRSLLLKMVSRFDRATTPSYSGFIRKLPSNYTSMIPILVQKLFDLHILYKNYEQLPLLDDRQRLRLLFSTKSIREGEDKLRDTPREIAELWHWIASL